MSYRPFIYFGCVFIKYGHKAWVLILLNKIGGRIVAPSIPHVMFHIWWFHSNHFLDIQNIPPIIFNVKEFKAPVGALSLRVTIPAGLLF